MWKRTAESRLRNISRQFPCACVLGARQVGKTTLAQNTFTKAAYYDLENPGIRQRIRIDPEGFLQEQKGMLILDEIQFLPELYQYLKVVIDKEKGENGRFVILGSASPELLKGVSESLAGRIGFIDLDPLISEESATGKPTIPLNELWLNGGYPGALLKKKADAIADWQDAYTRTFIERDLHRLGIDVKPNFLRKLITMIAHVHGGLWNASQLASSAGVSYHTINKYMEILEKAFLIRILAPYHKNIGKRLIKSPKVYLRDSGLLHFFLNIRNMDHLLCSPYCGNSWEGFITEELIRFEKAHHPLSRFFFFRTQTGVEADLLIDRNGEPLPVEIKLGANIEKRWVETLKIVMQDIKAQKGYLIYSGKETFTIEKNIKVISAYQKDFKKLIK